MVKRGWKIVLRPFSGKNYYRSGFERTTKAHYYVGYRTYPHLGGGPLAVFASRGDAEQFRASTPPPRRTTILPCAYDEIDTTFWDMRDPAFYRIAGRCLGGPTFCGHDFMRLVDVPEGTRLARWVEIEGPAK